jgi:aryl-alcohol dehydrogenase-like predicted oxidoreductase
VTGCSEDRRRRHASGSHERLARERYAKSVLALAVRWALDAAGVSVASWGGRSPEQLEPLDEVVGWSLDGETKRAIDEILRKVRDRPDRPRIHGSSALMRGTAAS